MCSRNKAAYNQISAGQGFGFGDLWRDWLRFRMVSTFDGLWALKKIISFGSLTLYCRVDNFSSARKIWGFTKVGLYGNET